MKGMRYIAAALMAFAVFSWSVTAQEGQTVGLKGLKVPLEYYPDGSLKAMLKAEVSTVDSAGTQIKGEGLTYETYMQGGVTDVVVTADNCVYDREKGMAESESKVTLVRGNVVVSGRGFKLDSKKEMLSLNSEVVVEFERLLRAGEKK